MYHDILAMNKYLM